MTANHSIQERLALQSLIIEVLSDGAPKSARWIKNRLLHDYNIDVNCHFISTCCNKDPRIVTTEKYARGYEYTTKE